MYLQENISLKSYNTLQIPVNAKYFVEIQNESELFELMDSDLRKSEKHYILNGGANLLFTRDFDGIIVKMEMEGKSIISKNDDNAIVEVYAGENRSDFVGRVCEQGLYGIENLIDIPGNVGTAPVSNIGAYGTEVSEYVYEVEGIDLNTREAKIYKKSECEFAYRTSIFKHSLKENFLITKVRFLFHYVDGSYAPNLNYADIQRLIQERNLSPKMPKEVADIIHEIRSNKLPDWHKIGTAGSFFANPIITKSERIELEKQYPDLLHHDYLDGDEMKIKLSAGQLIDSCGLKGWRIQNGTAGTYEKHALILVNEGGNADDVLEAMHYIQRSVYDKYGVHLEPEVVLV